MKTVAGLLMQREVDGNGGRFDGEEDEKKYATSALGPTDLNGSRIIPGHISEIKANTNRCHVFYFSSLNSSQEFRKGIPP